jgi:thioester reductase-like protein
MNERESIFITGATGFLGSVLVCDVLTRRADEVYCLVRRSDGGDPESRLREALARAGDMIALPGERLAPELHRVHAVVGDLTEPDLGIAAEDLARLRAANVRAAWHSAAYLRFEEEYRGKVFAQNVGGTSNVLDLVASLGIPELNYMSTAFVAGERAGEIPEESCAGWKRWRPVNPYEESKRTAEAFLERECALRGIYLRVFRPGIIIGASTTHRSTSGFSFDGFLYGIDRFVDWVRSRLEGYLERFPLALETEPGNLQNFVPVDVVAEEALEIAQTRTGSPEYHHLTNPYPVGIDTLVRGTRPAFPGVEIRATHDRGDLATLDHLFAKKLYFYRPYFFDSKRFARRKPLAPKFAKIAFTPQEIQRYAESFLGPSRRSLDAEGRRILEPFHDFLRERASASSVFRAGKGEPVMLLVPLGFAAALWEPVARVLRARCAVSVVNDETIYAPGGGTAAGERRSLEEALAAIQRAGARTRLVAWDTSVVRALQLCREAPDRIHSVLAMNPFLPMVRKPEELRTPMERGLHALIDEYSAPGVDRRAYFECIAEWIADNFVSRKLEAELPALERYVRAIPRTQRSLFLAPFVNEITLDTFRERNAPDRLPLDALASPPGVPLAVLRSEGDTAVHPELLARWARLCAHWEERVVASDSHALPLASVERVVQEIEDSRRPGRSPRGARRTRGSAA